MTKQRVFSGVKEEMRWVREVAWELKKVGIKNSV